jgi:hypothetical protein
MANKLWCKGEYEYDEYVRWVRRCLQKYIDLYCSDSEQFKVPEDITLDNLKEFIEIILKHYQFYHIKSGRMMDLGDAFDIFLGHAFKDEFPDDYPNYPRHDRRALTLYICDYIQMFTSDFIVPEDVPFILECLNAPNEEIIDMYDKLDKYFEQFDSSAKGDELFKRQELIDKQRLEAIEKNQPLPIKPMGMKLDPCYKKR